MEISLILGSFQEESSIRIPVLEVRGKQSHGWDLSSRSLGGSARQDQFGQFDRHAIGSWARPRTRLGASLRNATAEDPSERMFTVLRNA